MNVNFNLFNIIILLGALQGFILSLTLIFSRHDKRQGKYFLAAFMLMLVYDTFGTFCWSANVNIPSLDFFDAVFPYSIILTAGPSLYLYIRTTIIPEKITRRFILTNYLPALIDAAFRTLLLIYAFIYHKVEGSLIKPGDIDAIYRTIVEAAMVIIFWIYLIRAIGLLRKNRPDTVNETDIEKKLVYKWTNALLTVLIFVAAVWSVTIFGSLLFNFQGLGYFSPIEIILVIFTYWIGLKGYQHTRIVYIRDQKELKAHADALAPEETAAYIALLKNAMEVDKAYLDPTLTLGKLADRLNISARTISAVLNRELTKGFSEFVNEYRVNEVKQKMLQPENSHITIAGLAFESGFNSVATFQRVFKNFEQITPKQFITACKNQQN
ncbi:MAG TPA: helix-turn-helix domain-containing protein [Mucilaginibacter sp.]|nr:helix-turn-helix domain-containing protein [Mucilaginibacter sp.]